MIYFIIPFMISMLILSTYFLITFNKNYFSTNSDSSFECGIDVKGQSFNLISLKFIYISILFVLFDLEIIFIIMFPLKNNIYSYFLIMIILILLLLGLNIEYKNKFLLNFL
uniref:NADH-ubiquinone oxidoreductase chain 3 n=1 Tax=Chordodes sp. VVA-2019 TaxID=2586751 RepID=A0A514ABU8_9BILA|nr:NADH dehydrogenase subunit 3 [Chordodes sp. VVA-2019]